VVKLFTLVKQRGESIQGFQWSFSPVLSLVFCLERSGIVLGYICYYRCIVAAIAAIFAYKVVFSDSVIIKCPRYLFIYVYFGVYMICLKKLQGFVAKLMP
jgi:hypothetical protein